MNRLSLIFTFAVLSAVNAAASHPNVILIVTDDQGYGDMACHGNPWLQTPNLDRLYAESIRLTDYHVDPVCTPTRAALLTGRERGAYHVEIARMVNEDAGGGEQSVGKSRGKDASTHDSNSVDTSTLTNKVMCGYQGWFNCEGDGADLGWTHWAKNRRRPFAPGNVTVDLWPDVSELGADERYATGFRHADETAAEVFSSGNRKTVLRHFQWMRDYQIDGVFLQRFANGLDQPDSLRHKDNVLSHVRDGARQFGRGYAVMYDLSGLAAGEVDRVRRDWSKLDSTIGVTADSAYMHHDGKPVVAIWGVGFSDGRDYKLSECLELVRWLKAEGCTVMLGVPSFWREGKRDAVDDPMLHKILKQADIVSPWSVGRYRTPEEASRHATEVWRADHAWCEDHDLEFMPVVYPGFSWHNLTGDPLNAIPRRKGEFLWSQMTGAKQAGCNMMYVAMFDEVDEGTAIFKCVNHPPTANGGQFLTYEGLPSDHYLRLVGRGAQMLRGELPVDSPRSAD